MKKIRENLSGFGSQRLKELLANKSEGISYLFPLLIILLYLIFFFVPVIGNIFYTYSEISQLKTEISGTEQEWKNINSLKNRIAQQRIKIDAYKKKLPGEKEIAVILEYLSDAAKDLDIRLTEIKPIWDENKSADTALYYKVPIELKAECAYHPLGHFLNRLENADRFIKISDINIYASLERKNIHKVELTVSTYVMRK